MLLTELWEKEMYNTLQIVSGNKFKETQLKSLLHSYTEKSLINGDRKLVLRNLYERKIINLNMNEILDFIHEKDLVIGSNGSFSYSAQSKLGDTSIMITDDLDGRQREKNLAKEFEKKGMLKEANLHDVLQMYRKASINSTYGIACQPGSFLFNPDAASFITSQSRQLISEMLWSFERFLANNLVLTSYNEALLYCKNVLNKERHNDFRNYISFIPSKKVLGKYLLRKFAYISDFHKKTMKFSKLLFAFIDQLTEEDRLYLFYAFNLPALINLNPKVWKLFDEILHTNKEFLDPNKVPDEYRRYCDELIGVCTEYCYCDFTTTHRVDKYFDCNRYAILLSDTDSVFIILNTLMNYIYNKCGFDLKNTENDFKLVNTLCTLCTDYIAMRHNKFVEACNVKYRFPNYKLTAKNEFYYKRVVIYTAVKKNYSGLKLLREGNRVPEPKQISHTGIKLIASKIPKEVSDFQTSLLETEILRAKTINPITILAKIETEKAKLIQMMKSGDKSLGTPSRFSGYNKYANFKSTQICRLVEIFNRIYPEQKIGNGEYLMCFETVVKDKSQLNLIKDEKMRNKIEDVIYCDRYNGEDNYLKEIGIGTVGIPRDGDMFRIPDWLIDIIDYETMCRKHLQSVVDLFPSLNMQKAKLAGSKSTYSNLLSF